MWCNQLVLPVSRIHKPFVIAYSQGSYTLFINKGEYVQ
jgi:hypothetical protein